VAPRKQITTTMAILEERACVAQRTLYETTQTRSNGLMIPALSEQNDFDIAALFSALEAQRLDRALSWLGVAKEVWNQSAVLNARRKDHPISATTLTGMTKGMDTSCQHALFMLRWLGRPPESFVPGSTSDAKSTALPQVGPDRRLRWDLPEDLRSP